MSKRAKVIICTIGGALLITVIGFTYALLWTGSTKEIVGVADSFHIPADWKKVSEQVEPPRLVCIGDLVCPSLIRKYQAYATISSKELISKILPTNVTKVNYDVCGQGPVPAQARKMYMDCAADFILSNGYKGTSYAYRSYDKNSDEVEVSVSIRRQL